MVVGVILPDSQRDKADLLYECARNALPAESRAVNFGAPDAGQKPCTYVQTAVLVSLLLESGAVDFAVTGCSSGQGMMLACNSLPGVLCGYVPTPADAYLFGRINGGNAASLPLGLHFGWCGEVNARQTLAALFDGPLGAGYPPGEAARKQRDAAMVKEIARAAKRPLTQVLDSMDPDFLAGCLARGDVCAYLLAHGRNAALRAWLLRRGIC